MESMVIDFIQKISFYILTFLLKQSLFTIILFVIFLSISFLLRKKSPQWHYGLWLLILIRLLLPTDLSLSFSLRNAFDKIPDLNKITSIVDVLDSRMDFYRKAAPESDYSKKAGNSASHLPIESDNTGVNYFSFPAVLLLLWAVVCLLMFLAIIQKYLALKKIIDNSLSADKKYLLKILNVWCRALNVKRNVRIITSAEFLSPFSTGILKPKIYIPKSFLKSSNINVIESIIAHEMVHIKYFDVIWIKLQKILQVLFFFNPVVWHANRQINKARECICDSIVLNTGIISPSVYGDSLLNILKANLYGYEIMNLMPGIGNHKKIFSQRIHNIFNSKSLTKQKTLYIISVICISGFFLLPLAGNSQKITEKKSASVIVNIKKAECIQSRKKAVKIVKDIIPQNVSGKDLPTPEFLFAKCREALGGDSIDNHYNSKSLLEVYYSRLGSTFLFTSYKEKPNKALKINDDEFANGTDGDTAWYIEPQYGPSIVDDDRKNDLMLYYSFDITKSLSEILGKAETAGIEDVNGTPCYKVISYKYNKHNVYYYFNKKNFVLMKYSIDQNNLNIGYSSDIVFEDYKMIDNVLVAHSVKWYYAGEIMLEERIKNIEFNVDMPADIFVLPDKIKSLLLAKK